MDTQDRVKKQEPERTQPIRNWGVLSGTPGAPPPRTPPGGSASSGGSASPGNPVSRGVELGYQVIEEYLRQGRNVASAMGIPSFGEAPADDGLQGRMGALLRSFTDFASLWMELMSRVGGGGVASAAPGITPAKGTAGPFPTGGGPGASEPPKAAAPEPPVSSEPLGAAPVELTLDIQSSRRVEVSVELRPRSAGLPLVVHDLRAPEPDKPRLTGVRLETQPEEERVCLRLQVPVDHPAGIYSGLILDERTSLPRGTLTVRIPPA
ncbi:MAG: hypothetical protein ACJ8AT_11500 [Hyalangium sp.]|uniref:hypothetical protein n=1 Tax=Hyalangium sp. TaxID=2028555 RepID=UPI003899F47F